MSMRQYAAALLAATALYAGAAQACETSDSCPPGTAPSYPVTASPAAEASSETADAAAPSPPLRLTPARRKAQAKAPPKPAEAKTAETKSAEAKSAEASTDSANTKHKPETRRTARVKNPAPAPSVTPAASSEHGWSENVYAMDPARASAQAQAAPVQSQAVPIADPNELNEIDRMADTVRVVSADELNEIDLAAASLPAAETNGQAGAATAPVEDVHSAPAPQPMPTSWIAGLVMAFGGIAAAASAMLIRQARA